MSEQHLTTKEAISKLIADGMSKYAIAMMLGLSPIMISNYLAKSRMSSPTAYKMYVYFGIVITDAVVKGPRA